MLRFNREVAVLTLRQIEIIRAIILAGTVKGAADLLGVSAPGISRTMKHTETQLGIRLFSRRQGRFIPTSEAKGILDQINEVFSKVGNLHFLVERLKRGESSVFSFASVPSIAQHVIPGAIRRMRQKFPDLRMNVNILKIEEAIDYLLLKKGEVAAMSYKLDHPGLVSHQIGAGRLVAVLAEAHPLAKLPAVPLAELARCPLIGIAPEDPYGRIIASTFYAAGLPFNPAIVARFNQTILPLVAHDLGVAVTDEFSVADRPLRGLAVRPLAEPTSFKTYAVLNAETPRSIFVDALIDYMKDEMRAAAAKPF